MESRVASVHPIGAELRCATCGERFPADYAVCPRDATPLGVGSEPTDPLIGRILAGSYRITRLLAQGGMGRLYEAEHTRLPRRLAVKIIHDVYADNADAVARFEREARAAALVDSEHVVTVVDVTRTEDDRPCIVYERLEGEDLGRRIAREGSVPVADAIEIARQIASGLAAAHAAGIVHRDLKPANVFLAARPGARLSVKLLDFGVAKLLGAPEITRTGAVVGTPAYMAPEQARGAEDVDGRADVYGLGAVLYKMLSGRAPFEARDATASLTGLLAGPPRPLAGLAADLPIDLIRFVEDAMARDPHDRSSDLRALEARLAEIAGEVTPDETRPPGAPQASAEATAVMPRGVVDEAVETRRALARRRPLSVVDVIVLAFAVSACAAIVASHLTPSALAVVVVSSLTFGAALALGGRRARDAWCNAPVMARRHLRVRAALRTGCLVLGGFALVGALLSILEGAGPAPLPWTFALGSAVAAFAGAGRMIAGR